MKLDLILCDILKCVRNTVRHKVNSMRYLFKIRTFQLLDAQLDMKCYRNGLRVCFSFLFDTHRCKESIHFNVLVALF